MICRGKSDIFRPARCFIIGGSWSSMMGTIIAIVVGSIVAGTAAAGIICYRRYALPNMQTLSVQDLEICRDIVAARQGYPFICRRALKTGECACYPCEKLLVARGVLLQR